MVIDIRRLEVVCCHGALDFEKIKPQPFYISASLEGDLWEAAQKDELEKTINYADVCAVLERTARGNTFNLIEKLNYECAFAVLENFSKVRAVTVTVEKPQAPVPQKVENLSVTQRYERETCYLSMGSSMGDRKGYLDFAVKKLSSTRGIRVESVSDYINTPPYGGAAKNEFLNCAVKISTFLPPRKLLDAIHGIEAEAGRTREVRWGDRTLDIDIIFYGKRVVCDDDLIIPHPDYANRDFVLTPLKQICGGFVCPVKKQKIINL